MAKTALRLGAGLMLIFYIVGFASLIGARYVDNYFHAMSLYRGCLEAAPASLLAGVGGGLLGDLMLRGSGNKKEKDE
ncbi:MAG: hypothetical protein LBU86_03175 [Oscillospiraceae bacterium]|nr:hypothetical protein [Oscillospiraceae bacterium]